MDNIRKSMQLVGELVVPTTKVSQVLQSVSKWLYDKDINKTDLPSTATVNIAQVPGKYQLADGHATMCGVYGTGSQLLHRAMQLMSLSSSMTRCTIT